MTRISSIIGFATAALLLAGVPVVSSAQSTVPEGGVFRLPEVPEPPAGPSVTLAEAIRQADSTNRSLQALREDITIAASKLKASWAGLLPTLYGSAGYSYSDSVSTAAASTSGVSATGGNNQINVGLSLNVPLIQARQWALVDYAKLESGLTELQVEQSRQILLYSVAEAYYQAATALTLITVYRAQFAALDEHLQLAQARMDAGVGNVIDVRSAQTDLVSSWVEIVKAGYSLADAREALGILMGAGGAAPMPVIDSNVAVTPESGISSDLLSAMGAAGDARLPAADVAVGDRWDLKVLDRQVEMMNKELKAGYMAFVPTLNGSVNYFVDVLGAADGTNSDPDGWTVGLNLSIPIFDYTNYPALRQNKATIRQARLQMEQLEIEGAAAIAQAGRSVQKLYHIMAAQKVKAVLSDDLLALAEADYANGTGLAIAVTDARRTALAAHVELATATWEYELGKLQLDRETGVDIMKALEDR